MSETMETPAAEAVPATDPLADIYDRAVAEPGMGHNGGPDLPREPDGKFAKPAAEAPAEKVEPAAETPAAPAADEAPKLPDGMALNIDLLNPTARAAFLQDLKEGRLHLSPPEPPAAAPDPVRLIADEFKGQYEGKGLDQAGAVRALFEAQKFLDSSPVDGVLWLAQQYGVADKIAARLGVQTPAGQPDPVIAELRAEVAQLKQWRGGEEAQRAERQMAETAAKVQEFAKGKDHFELVRAQMAPMVHAGMSLDDAYTAACAVNPTVRSRIAQAEEAKQRADAAARSAQARKGAGFNLPATNGVNAARPTLEASAGDIWDRHAGVS